jgi:hypothetical protein
MVFWIAVVIGGLFAFAAVQVGFYSSWIMLFNLVLSAYMAIFLGPMIVETVPATTDTEYGYALVLLTIGIATLVTAYGICYASLSGRFRVEFPVVFDKIGAGVLGFLGGFLISSFVTFALALTPLREMDALRPFGLDAVAQRESRSAIRSYLCGWCDVLHTFVASSDAGVTSKEVVDMLLDKAVPQAEAVVPARAAQPSDRKAGASQTTVDPKAGAQDTQPKKSPGSGPENTPYYSPGQRPGDKQSTR